MKQNKMAFLPIPKLLLTMSLPPMISMLIQSLYNIIDSIFVANLGQDALTAVSLAFPLQSLALAFGVGVGIALSALLSRSLGEKDFVKANRYIQNGFFLSFIHSILFVIIGIFVVPYYLSLFTSDQAILQDAIMYGSVVTTFAFGQIFHIAIEKIFQATGDMLTPMILLLVGAICNIILDPILIFGINGFLEFGVMGAAMATVSGQLIACILAIYMYKKKITFIDSPFTKIKANRMAIKHLYSIAIPSGLVLAIPSVVVSLLNGLLASILPSAVAFYGIYYKVQSFIYMPASGISQGMRPIIGYNYGAKLMDRVHLVIKIGFISMFIILLIGTGLFLFLPKQILLLFNATPELLSIGIPGMQILGIAMLCSAVGYFITGIFEAFGRGNYSLYVTLTRQILFTLPIAYLLSPVIGVHAVWIGYVAGEVMASVLGIILYKKLTL